MIPAATREAQATACLEAADRYREPLLALARCLAGNDEDGMDLYQQTLLNCHDAIQRVGFAGDRYEFYLRTALKNLHRKLQKAQRKHHVEPLPEELAEAPAPATDGLADLAEQMMDEVREQFSPADRVALRLHADGYSCREIAELTGQGDRWHIRWRLDKLKAHLRETFRQAWEALGK